jgi:hypothetical protein
MGAKFMELLSHFAHFFRVKFSFDDLTLKCRVFGAASSHVLLKDSCLHCIHLRTSKQSKSKVNHLLVRFSSEPRCGW